MKVLIIFCAIFTIASSQRSSRFDEWAERCKIEFKDEKTEQQKRDNFFKNEEFIHQVNSKLRSTFTLELNKFAAHSIEEFLNERCGLRRPNSIKANLWNAGRSRKVLKENFVSRISQRISKILRRKNINDTIGGPFGSYSENNAPAQRNFQMYTFPVLDQGSCGSCWAFATMSQIESLLKIRDIEYNTALSPQYLVNCDLFAHGCSGGWPTQAMSWIQSSLGGKNKAVPLKNYPYKDTKGLCFTLFKPKPTVSISSVHEVEVNGDENKMKAIVASNGPVVIAIEATKTFMLYKSGVLFDSTADTACKSVNHAVVIVGYGRDKTLGDYWLIKNSWGKTWGENGYIRIARNKGNRNNVACFAMYTL